MIFLSEREPIDPHYTAADLPSNQYQLLGTRPFYSTPPHRTCTAAWSLEWITRFVQELHMKLGREVEGM